MNLYKHLKTNIEQNNLYDYSALTFHNKSISYKQLLNCIEKYAFNFSSENQIGIIYLKKSEKFIFSLLALNYSKNIFCPIDCETPLSRFSFLTKELDPKWIITDKLLTFLDQDYSQINFDGLFIYIKKQTAKKYITSLTHVYLSSGSTGFPKIIYLSDEYVIPVIEQQIKVIEIFKSSNFAWLLSTSFDASLSDIFVSLFSGANLHICSFKQTNTKTLNKYFIENKITHSDLSPSILSLLNFHNLHFLKHIVIGGELANQNTVLSLHNQFQINFYNAYGPTEATICSSMKKIDTNWVNSDIGLPFKGIDYLIVDGELLINGHLFLGYSDNALTSKKIEIINNKKYYHSGDLVCFKNNSFHYMGRKDRQFKKNGNLICPEEIENFCKNNGCDIAVLHNIDNTLELTYTGLIEIETIKHKIMENFPSYMVPQKIFKIDDIKRNINGKIMI